MNNEKPYIKVQREVLCYNPMFGDDRECKCGHVYYRHFDTHQFMESVGCKYCGCWAFVEFRDVYV